LPGSSLEMWKILCNGQNFLLIGQVTNTLTSSFGSMHWKAQIHLGEACCSWLGYYSLWLRYLFRSSLELYKLLCNGQNFPLIGQVTKTFTSFFGSMCWGDKLGRGVLVLVGMLMRLVPSFVRTDKLGRGVLVLVGLLQPLVP
jgi:hypothetical protein